MNNSWPELFNFQNSFNRNDNFSGRVENAVRIGENAGYQHFLLFPQCFQKPSSIVSLKVWIVWQRRTLQDYTGISGIIPLWKNEECF